MNRKIKSLVKGLVVMLALLPGMGAAQTIGSTNDLWDVSQGTTVLTNSPLYSGMRLLGEDFDIRDIFGGAFGTISTEPNVCIFDDHFEDGFVHFVEWHTSSNITVRSFDLYAQGDCPTDCTSREFASFTLKAKSPGSSSFDLVLCTFTPTHPYTLIDPTNYLLVSTDIQPVTAQDFRAEFVNWTGSTWSGPRIIELDGFGQQRSISPCLLSISNAGAQMLVSWPDGLGLVQPQRNTNSLPLNWLDFGPSLTVTSVVDTVSNLFAFYRLRFLPPVMVTPPQSTTNGVGGTAMFSVTATGTTPFDYQWLKHGTNLVGQTATNLVLSGLITNDADFYSVLITNRVGSVTSAVAFLTVTNPPAASYQGIYTGQFAGQADAGGFAVMVRSNQTGVTVGYDSVQDEGLYADGFVVASNGTTSFTTTEGGKFSGIVTSSGVSGNFTNFYGVPGTFSGTRRPDTGIQQTNAGYYVGTFSGTDNGTARAILAADGTLFFFTDKGGVDNNSGGFGTVNAENVVSGSTVPTGTTISGTLDTITKVMSGTYSLGTTKLGTWTMTQTESAY